MENKEYEGTTGDPEWVPTIIAQRRLTERLQIVFEQANFTAWQMRRRTSGLLIQVESGNPFSWEDFQFYGVSFAED